MMNILGSNIHKEINIIAAIADSISGSFFPGIKQPISSTKANNITDKSRAGHCFSEPIDVACNELVSNTLTTF